ncbi:hypothetical protein E2C01_088019 [Portunus trituberculatus]|uniref:Uncharacterized protein n=1 Tax=Portunus trituberculatus TaxID=210409 RepID=A0A5B7JFK7_PORTR|nr:hypothetical protein [Portunus trituberculatus]
MLLCYVALHSINPPPRASFPSPIASLHHPSFHPSLPSLLPTFPIPERVNCAQGFLSLGGTAARGRGGGWHERKG